MTEDQRNLTPKERASAYKARYGRQPKNDNTEDIDDAAGQKIPARRTPYGMDHWSDIVGQRIEEAMRQGYFDNLSGHGKPLDLNKNPYVPEDMQMANSLMENNGLTPGWIGDRKSVLGAIERFREELTATIVAYAKYRWQSESDEADTSVDEKVDEELEVQLEAFREELVGLNKRIEVINIEQPVQHLEIFKLAFSTELEFALLQAKEGYEQED